uniref:Uncharacterized protein n=1 Tax=Haemonchus contortus TaxID=6289 RepID=A0A7I4XY31_HAECO
MKAVPHHLSSPLPGFQQGIPHHQHCRDEAVTHHFHHCLTSSKASLTIGTAAMKLCRTTCLHHCLASSKAFLTISTAAMKLCRTTCLHHCLARHPSPSKPRR